MNDYEYIRSLKEREKDEQEVDSFFCSIEQLIKIVTTTSNKTAEENELLIEQHEKMMSKIYELKEQIKWQKKKIKKQRKIITELESKLEAESRELYYWQHLANRLANEAGEKDAEEDDEDVIVDDLSDEDIIE